MRLQSHVTDRFPWGCLAILTLYFGALTAYA